MEAEIELNKLATPRSESSTPLKKVAGVLVTKAVCDLVFVLALVVMFFISAFNYGTEAFIEVADGRQVIGHILSAKDGKSPPEVELYINGDFVAATRPQCETKVADRNVSRRCAFRFDLSGLGRGEYEAQIFASRARMERTLPAIQLLEAERRFTVAEAER